MVSVKRLLLGPEVAFNNHLDVHSVIAHSEKLLPIVNAVSQYIHSKHKRGRSQEEIIDKLERLETVYLHVTQVHDAFHMARQENNLPISKVLTGRIQPYYRVPLRSASPTPTSNTESTLAHYDTLPSGISTAVHSQVDLLPAGNRPTVAAELPGPTNSGSWRRFIPGARRNTVNAQSPPSRRPIPSAMRSPAEVSPTSSVVTVRAAGIEASVVPETVHTDSH
ncbi:hypothetical protein DACRYDRAFT_23365 [Dacryopinax primogenitus]|uniref:Uncharacterized protein n=1 Tax=Dacryopinax primogenitus (strain DJM 731) TaxID=1858805 RepID=M5G1P0_DACPD|nr:uncharacterized protein DACRYDRAFT_23365 [Dacryopinax primogenitus]EJT99781.1 hypothetical protein DACRYDRAFT_23365 [Dacryopinax primogenitus]